MASLMKFFVVTSGGSDAADLDASDDLDASAPLGGREAAHVNVVHARAQM